MALGSSRVKIAKVTEYGGSRKKPPKPLGGLDGFYLFAESVCRRPLTEEDRQAVLGIFLESERAIARGEGRLTYSNDDGTWKYEPREG